jgi:2-methylisocitrate lyase-like PEP mutase family enzyme
VALFQGLDSGTQQLKQLLAEPGLLQAPGCFDALSAKQLEAAGFTAAFLGGFSVAATRLGLPDVGLLSFSEMLDQTRSVCGATGLPIIADADTGYGNAMNAQRSFIEYSRAGVACMMIEDQLWPKQCGHTEGKQVVSRKEAVARVRACVRTREDLGVETLIMARSDAAAAVSFEEALWRTSAFADEGADITFLEAPRSIAEMQRYCAEVPGIKTANLVEDGRTPWLSPSELEDIGYSIVLYPVTLLLSNIAAMRDVAVSLKGSGIYQGPRATFDEARAAVDWPAYDAMLAAVDQNEPTPAKE